MADEYVRQLYRGEEDFLDHFLGTVEVLLPILAAEHGADWRPNYACNDRQRWAQQLRLNAGQLDALTFDEAVIFHGREGFSSLQLRLQSSRRLLIVRVRRVSSIPGVVRGSAFGSAEGLKRFRGDLRQDRERDSGCIPRSDMAHCDAAGVNGSNRILSHGAPPPADDAEWMSGKSRARLAPILTEASSWMSDRRAQSQVK
jgi:hypothetical protein